MGASSFLANRLLEASVAKTPFSVASPTFLALLIAPATDESTGSTIQEASYTGYGRIPLADSVWRAAASGVISNALTVTPLVCTAGSSTIIGWAICTASSGGEVLWHGVMPAIVIDTDDPAPPIGPDTLFLQLD